MMSRALIGVNLGYALSYGAVAIGAERERIVEAFNWTVVFLMAMPYVIVAGAAGWIGYHYMRARQKRLAHERGSGLQLIKKENLEDD
jgi:hypothetical protein